MEYTIKLETVEMNTLKVSSLESDTIEFYSLDEWSIGLAIDDYINNKLME